MGRACERPRSAAPAARLAPHGPSRRDRRRHGADVRALPAGRWRASSPSSPTRVVAPWPHEPRAAPACRSPSSDAVAEELPIADGAVDAAVTSLALCSVSDVARALAELRRVLRPGGELRFLEHVLAERGPLRLLQRLAAPVYSRIPDGCHIDRDTLASIARSGFTIEECDRFMHADGALEPAIPHVIGTARRREIPVT